jgi:5-methylcytosine-specific restriction endonuclease McrA
MQRVAKPRAGRWSLEQLASRERLNTHGPHWDEWTDRNKPRGCRVCRGSFWPTTGRSGAISPWCSDDCRQVWIAYAAQEHRLGRYWRNDECKWCFGRIVDAQDGQQQRSTYCSRSCFLAANRHLGSNAFLDRCAVPTCRDCGLVGCVKWKKTRRQHKPAFIKAPRGRCRECEAKHRREYELARPMRTVRDKNRKRNQAIARGDEISPVEVVRRFGTICYLCGLEIDLTIAGRNDPQHLEIDHIWPISRGGEHKWDNVAPVHRRCNQSKGKKVLTPPAWWKGTWTE